MNRIALIGYRGCGKSTVGPILAAKLGWRFLDADAELEMHARRSVAAIFADDGEDVFRDIESENLVRLAVETEIVLATGGGVVLREANRDLLKTACVVWLDTPPVECWRRIENDTSTVDRRPRLTVEGGFEEVKRLMAERAPLYEAVASLRINGSEAPEIVAGLIAQQVPK